MREALAEIKGPAVFGKDFIKSVMFGKSDTYLSTVKVDLCDDDSRAYIMKNKKNLVNHQNPVMQESFIKNLKTENQMALENFSRDVPKIIPGGNNHVSHQMAILYTRILPSNKAPLVITPI